MKKTLGLFLTAAVLAAPLLTTTQAQAAPPMPGLFWNPATQPLTVKQLAHAQTDSVVMIEMFDEKNKAISSGSGIILSADGLILTNFHVIDPGVKAKITLANQTTYETTQVLIADKDRDLALIKVDAAGLHPAVLGDSTKMEIGDGTFAIGSPNKLQNTVSTGIISGIRHEDGLDYLQTTAPYTHGSSGGALFNMQGELIGVTCSIVTGGGDLNFAIPSRDVQAFLQKTRQPQKLGTFSDPKDTTEPDEYAAEDALNEQLGTFQLPATGEKVPLSFYVSLSYADDAPEDLYEIDMTMQSDNLYKYLVSDPAKPDSQQTADLLDRIIKIARSNGIAHATVTLENSYETRKVGTFDLIDNVHFNNVTGAFRITHVFAWASYDDKSESFTYLMQPGHNDIEQKKKLD